MHGKQLRAVGQAAQSSKLGQSNNNEKILDKDPSGSEERLCASRSSPTLLEIEELVQEYDEEYSQNEASGPLRRRIRVERGGCVGFCSMGPTVSVVLCDSESSNNKISDKENTSRKRNGLLDQQQQLLQNHFFNKVDSVSACADVLRYAKAIRNNEQTTDNANGIVVPPLMRRAEGLRWKALRELSREMVRSTSAKGHVNNHAREILQTAVDAELGAVRSSAEQISRAKRRHERLLTVLDKPIS